MPRPAFLPLTAAALLAACSGDPANPFGGRTRPASARAAAMFVSSSWAGVTGQPRELMAIDLDGAGIETLTSCSQLAEPCTVLRVAVSNDPNRVALVRAPMDAVSPGAGALYFVDLSRSAEKLILPTKKVSSVDWAPDSSFLIYESPTNPQTGAEDLFVCAPTGANDQNLTSTANLRERSPRADPLGRTAAYEVIDQNGTGRIYLYASGGAALAVTSGVAPGPPLPDTPYTVGSDADPVFSPEGDRIALRRLTGLGNAGLGTWELCTVKLDGTDLACLAGGPVHVSAPDWGPQGLLFVETEAMAARSRLVVVQPDGTGRRILHEEDASFGMDSPRWIPGRASPGS